MKSVTGVYGLYGKPDRLLFQTPLEINRMTEAMEEDIVTFYSGIINKKTE